jgi:hypothetical protein
MFADSGSITNTPNIILDDFFRKPFSYFHIYIVAIITPSQKYNRHTTKLFDSILG